VVDHDEGGDPACWAEEFADVLGYADPPADDEPDDPDEADEADEAG
jgi:hypothetical protein